MAEIARANKERGLPDDAEPHPKRRPYVYAMTDDNPNAAKPATALDHFALADETLRADLLGALVFVHEGVRAANLPFELLRT